MGNTSFDITDIDVWKDNEVLICYLARQLRKGRMALFIGSGISAPFLNLEWGSLVDELLASKGMTASTSDSLETKVANYRYHYFEKDTPGYLEAVKSILYSKANSSFHSLRKNATLGAIGALVMASSRGSAKGVVTLNFDDILEKYLKYHGFVTSSIAEDVHWDGSNDVTVYHPHGFLPSDLQNNSSDIVFDKNSYGRALGQDGSKWREIILSMLRTHTCLFLGLSGADLQLTSWLSNVCKEHPATVKGVPYWGVSFSTKDDPGTNATWKNLGVFCKKIDDYKIDLPEFLFKLCQKAAQF